MANVARQQLPGAIEDTAQRQLQEHSSTLSELSQLQNHRLRAVIIAEVEALLDSPVALTWPAFTQAVRLLSRAIRKTLEDR